MISQTDQINETPTPKKVTTWTASNILGEIVTVSSIVPSGLFAALLTDLLLESLNVSVNYRIAVDMVIFVATIEPKRRLMRAYNTETFEHLLAFKCQDLFLAKNFTLANSVNQFSSLLDGVTFGGLAYFSLLQLADLTRSDHSQTGNEMAVAAEYPVTLAYLISSSFIANYLSFPSMQSAAVGLLHNALSEFLLTAQEQHHIFNQQALLVGVSTSLMANFNTLSAALRLPIEQRELKAIDASYLAIKEQLLAIYPSAVELPENSSDIAAITSLLKYMKARSAQGLVLSDVLANTGNTALHHPKLISLLSRMISFGLTAICIAGLSNFYGIAVQLFSIVEPVILAPLLAALVMVSMSLLAFISVYAYGPLLTNKWEQGFNKTYPEVLTSREQRQLFIGNSIMCAMGSLPNTYQALVLVKQSPPLVACAFVASFSLEVKASYDVTRAKKERAVIEALQVEAPVMGELFEQLKQLDALRIQKPTKTMADFYRAVGCSLPENTDSTRLLLLEDKSHLENQDNLV